MKTVQAALLVTMGLAGGCLGGQVDTGFEHGDMSAPAAKTPAPANGSGTAPDCSGATEKGSCVLQGDSEVAVTCDLDTGMAHKLDCTAMSKHCTLDAHKGASCVNPPPAPTTAGATDGGAPAGKPKGDGGTSPPMTTPPPPAPPGTPPKPPAMPAPAPTPPPAPHDLGTTAMPDMSMADLCNHGVTFTGYCSGSTAVWCDPSTGQIITWACDLDGYACEQDGCADGAYCCGQAVTMPDMAGPVEPSPECNALGYAGECQGGAAVWCDNGQIYTVDCAGRGQTCEVDTCSSGAFCCDAATTPPDPPAPSECDQLGLLGVCGGLDGNTVRYCSDGTTIVEDDCDALGEQCQVDTCGAGANCCPL